MHISREAAKTLPPPARHDEGVGRGQNDVIQSIKMPQNDVVLTDLVWFPHLYKTMSFCILPGRFLFAMLEDN